MPVPTSNLAAVKIQDTYKKFLKGFYPILRLGRRHYRKIGSKAIRKSQDRIETIHETIDASVFERWREDGSYRPKNLSKLFKSNSRITSHIGDYTITQEDRH